MTEQLLQTWDINGKINAYFLAAVEESVLWEKPPKGKPVGGQFTHMHSVRLMWLKAASTDLLEGLDKPEEGASREAILSALSSSHAAMRQLLSNSFETGTVKGFKPNAAAFLGYLLAHDAHHRGQAELVLRLLGKPISDKASYGLWEWNSRLQET